MPILLFTKQEAADLLDQLIESEALRVAAWAKKGEPLFSVADLRAACDEIAYAAKVARRGRRKATTASPATAP